jgi:protein-tyrosine-phosphatase
MAPRITKALARADIESSDFRSKPLTQHLVERAQLILTAETAHRAAVVRLEPTALGRVFTLRQFARLIPEARTANRVAAELHGLRALVQACSAARGMGQPARGAEDDVEDPWGRSGRAYRRSMKSIDVAITVIADGITAATRTVDGP